MADNPKTGFNAGSGAAAGASAGAALGPVGAGVGAVVGAIGGAINQSSANRSANKAWQRTVDEENRRRAEDRAYNDPKNQMARLMGAGISASGAASAVTGNNSTGNLASPSSGHGVPTAQTTGPNLNLSKDALSGYMAAAQLGNITADTAQKGANTNLTRLEALGAQYDNALKSNNVELATQTLGALVDARNLDNLKTQQEIYNMEVEAGLTKARTFNEWRYDYFRRRQLAINQENAAANTANAETNREGMRINWFNANTGRMNAVTNQSQAATAQYNAETGRFEQENLAWHRQFPQGGGPLGTIVSGFSKGASTALGFGPPIPVYQREQAVRTTFPQLSPSDQHRLAGYWDGYSNVYSVAESLGLIPHQDTPGDARSSFSPPRHSSNQYGRPGNIVPTWVR